MKTTVKASILFSILFTSLMSTALVSRANAAANSPEQSGLTRDSIEDSRFISHHDCYVDTYGNLHCW
ncbi:MAG: hypothetical protein AAGB01_01210 [Cyanobacteria bacterium P01_F01_bin.42]